MEPSDHLLRTLAAVPPGVRVVDLGCGDGHHTVLLAQLGFDVWAVDPDPDGVAAARRRLADVLGDDEAARRVSRASVDALGFPDAFADWAVLAASPDRVAGALAEAARVLRPGAWVWVGGTDAAGWDVAASAAGLVVAEGPGVDRTGWVHAVFRRPSDVG